MNKTIGEAVKLVEELKPLVEDVVDVNIDDIITGISRKCVLT